MNVGLKGSNVAEVGISTDTLAEGEGEGVGLGVARGEALVTGRIGSCKRMDGRVVSIVLIAETL